MPDPTDGLTRTEREMLKAIHRRAPDGDRPAHTGELAEDLGVTAGTATNLVKRLAERGLVDHRPYRGAVLTPEGRRAAVSAIRRHRIVERFLSDFLGYAWHEADRLAPTFEHDLPEEVLERIFVALDRPTECPHGFPIPAREVTEIPELPPLYDLEPGDRAVVAVPGATDPEVVRFLEGLGVRPGVEVEVLEKHPFDGPLVVRVGGEARALGRRVATHIRVTQLTRGGAPWKTSSRT